jgi:hypothetical protein
MQISLQFVYLKNQALQNGLKDCEARTNAWASVDSFGLFDNWRANQCQQPMKV